MRIRTDDPAYPVLCAGCEVCGRFPYIIAQDIVWRVYRCGHREIVRADPFACCERHQRDPREEWTRVPRGYLEHLKGGFIS